MAELSERDRDLLDSCWDFHARCTSGVRTLSPRRVLNALAAAREEGRCQAMTAHFRRQRDWSLRTFGPGARTGMVLDHIRKELHEVEAAPASLEEWIDVAILAFDGAWRAGHEPDAIATAWIEKHALNEAREWPDWRTTPQDKAIEHVRDGQREATRDGGAIMNAGRSTR